METNNTTILKELIETVEDYPSILENISFFNYQQYIISGSNKNIYIWPYNMGPSFNTRIINNEKIVSNVFTSIGNNLFFVTEFTGNAMTLNISGGQLTMMCYNMKIYDVETGLMTYNFSLDSENIVKIIVSPDLKYFAKITLNTITIIKIYDLSIIDTIRFDIESEIIGCFSTDSKQFLYTHIFLIDNISLNTLNISTFEREEINTSIRGDLNINRIRQILVIRNKIILELGVSIQILSLEGTLLHSFNYDYITYTGLMSSIKISPNQEKIVYGFQDARNYNYSIRVINLNDYSSTYILDAHPDKIRDIIFINDNIIATASIDKTVKIWNINGTLIQTLEHDQYVQTLNYLFISNIESLLMSTMKIGEEEKKPKGLTETKDSKSKIKNKPKIKKK